MLPGIERGKRYLVVHVQRRGNHHSIHIFALNEFSIIDKRLWLAAGKVRAFGQVRFEDVTHSSDLRIGYRGEIANEADALIAWADHPDIDSIVCPQYGGRHA